jgi:eukaryotic-like serine/threonine-protein kinase
MLNVVCNQTPDAGTAQPPGTVINIFTASTTTTTTPETDVPDVAGDSVSQACSRLGNAGFSCSGTQNQVSSNFNPGTVVNTTPASGTPEPPGATITLNVSSGPQTVFVPDVIGDPESTAVSTLQGDNLTPVVSCQQTGGDSVVAQNPQGGASEPSGTDVTITVSMSSCPGGSTTTTTTTMP